VYKYFYYYYYYYYYRLRVGYKVIETEVYPFFASSSQYTTENKTEQNWISVKIQHLQHLGHTCSFRTVAV